MKKLMNLSNAEILHYVMGSKRLREKFENYIHESEMEWVSEKLAVFNKYKGALRDWSIGAYNQDYLRMGDPHAVLYAIEDSRDYFGASDRVEKKIAMCNKLRGTNLFEHHVRHLLDLYYEDELRPITKWIEDCSYDIYIGEESERLLDYVEIFAERIDDIYVNNEDKLVRMDYVA